MVFLVTLVLLDLLLEGFNLPYECTHWRCDCGVFGDLGVAGFASRGIQLTI